MTRNWRRNSASRTGLSELGRLAAGALFVGVLSAGFNSVQAQGELKLGRTGSGALSTSDPKLDDNSHYDLWTYRGQAGERIKVTLKSSDFDAYLAVGRMEGSQFSATETNDDGAGGTDAELKMTLPETGEYHVRVNSLAAGEKGAYSILIEEAPASVPAVSQGDLRLGGSGSGALSDTDPRMDDDSYYDLWSYRGRAGETIKVTLRSSDFDSYLVVGKMVNGDFQDIQNDDDGAGGNDARVVLTLSEDAEYAIRVNSLAKGETGPYSVIVEQADPSEVEADDDSEARSDVLPEPTTIHAGQTLNAELSETDAMMMSDSSRYDLFAFSAKRGQRATVIMRSKAFDSYLTLGRIEDGSFSTLESDDDTGGEEDAKIDLNIPRDGQYAIRANSLFSHVSGPYTIRLEMGVAPPAVVVAPQPIRYGQTVTGELSESDPQMDDDSHYDLWKFTGKRGEMVTITMKSGTFDTHMGFGRMEGEDFSQIESNDDGGGGTDSRLEVTMEADGEYVIRANSLFSKGLGAYTLNLVRGR